jgi:hypothetical protein
MNLRTVYHWKAAVVAVKRQKQIGPAQDNRIHVLGVVQLAPNREEQLSLLLRCVAAGRESDIGFMSGCKALPSGNYNFYAGHSVHARGHYHLSPQQTYAAELAANEFHLQFCYRIYDGQGGEPLEFTHAKMSRH